MEEEGNPASDGPGEPGEHKDRGQRTSRSNVTHQTKGTGYDINIDKGNEKIPYLIETSLVRNSKHNGRTPARERRRLRKKNAFVGKKPTAATTGKNSLLLRERSCGKAGKVFPIGQNDREYISGNEDLKSWQGRTDPKSQGVTRVSRGQ